MGLSNRLGIESFDNPLDENHEGFIATGDESETASAAILDATQESADVDAEADVADKIDDAQEDLEDQVELGEAAVESNTFTAAAAHFQKLAFKNALAKIASPAVAASIANADLPAIESFNDDPRRAGTLATEAIKETLREFWQTVKAQFKKLWTNIRNWYESTIAAAPRLKSRAQRIQKRAENIEGTVKGKIKVSAAGTIHVDGQLGAKATGAFDTLLTKAKEVLAVKSATDLEAGAKGIVDEVEALGKAKSGKGSDALSKKVKDALIPMTGGNVASEIVKTYGDSNEVSVTGTVELNGGNQLIAITGKGEARDVARRTKNAKVSFRKKQPDLGGKEFDALSGSQVQNLMEKVMQACEVIIDFKKAWERMNKFQDTIVSAGDKATGEVSKDLDSTTQRELRTLISASVGVFRKGATFRKDVCQMLLSVGGGLCSYAESSLSAHSTKD